MFNLAGEHHDEPAQRMARRQHAIKTRKRIEASEPHLGLVRQALHWLVEVPQLKILRQKQPVPSQWAADREARLEPTETESFAQPRNQIAWLNLPLVRS